MMDESGDVAKTWLAAVTREALLLAATVKHLHYARRRLER
jgi:hypothetical protein